MKQKSSLKYSDSRPGNIWRDVQKQWRRSQTLPPIPEELVRECYDAAPAGSQLEKAIGALL